MGTARSTAWLAIVAASACGGDGTGVSGPPSAPVVESAALSVETGDVVVLTPAGESWIDPEVLRVGSEHMITWQTPQGEVWVAAVDPRSGLVVDGSSRLLGDGAAPLTRTFNGPELGLDEEGWAVYYTKLVDGFQQVVRVERDGASEVLTVGSEHFSPLPTVRPDADSTRLVLLRRPPEWGTLEWVDTTDAGREHELVHLDERTDGDARWAVGTATMATNAHPGRPGQVSLLDTDTGEVAAVTDDDHRYTVPYAWAAPEAGGDLMALAVVDGTELAVWSDEGSAGWSRIVTLSSPDPSHPYLGSPEPFVAGGRSWISFTAADAPTARPDVTSQQVWLVPIDSPMGQARRCDDGAVGPETRVDPEVLVGTDQAFVYYYTARREGFTAARCATGIRA